MTNTIKTLNRLDELGEVITRGEPAEVLYGLGQGEERTECIFTYRAGGVEVVSRIDSSPLVKLYRAKDGILMDITDSNGSSDKYSYKGLRPNGAIFEQPTHPAYELGDLVINLRGDDSELAISQFFRSE